MARTAGLLFLLLVSLAACQPNDVEDESADGLRFDLSAAADGDDEALEEGFPIAAGTEGVYPCTEPVKGMGYGNCNFPYWPSQLVTTGISLRYTWTCGYVTGYCNAAGDLCFTVIGAPDDNVLLSDTPTSTDAKHTVVVHLLDDDFMQAVSLRRHPERLGHRIRFATASHRADGAYPHYTLLAPPGGDNHLHDYCCDWLDL